MLEVCKACGEAGFPVYLYGSSVDTVNRLKVALERRFHKLVVAGAEPSLFRELSPVESIALGTRIADSGARIVFIGLGCPRQETFCF